MEVVIANPTIFTKEVVEDLIQAARRTYADQNLCFHAATDNVFNAPDDVLLVKLLTDGPALRHLVPHLKIQMPEVLLAYASIDCEVATMLEIQNGQVRVREASCKTNYRCSSSSQSQSTSTKS